MYEYFLCPFLKDYVYPFSSSDYSAFSKACRAAKGNEQSGDEENSQSYQDGVYAGEAEGFGGPISLEVTVEEGKITAIEILSAEKEDGAYFAMAQDVIPDIIEKQSADVDTISGATFSSTGIRDAARQALEKAE